MPAHVETRGKVVDMEHHCAPQEECLQYDMGTPHSDKRLQGRLGGLHQRERLRGRPGSLHQRGALENPGRDSNEEHGEHQNVPPKKQSPPHDKAERLDPSEAHNQKIGRRTPQNVSDQLKERKG
jgi:hypothetical protein